ncbi:MAG: branched-chain amino acid ABC transporter permease [Candidatus Rokubacteria bacterium]|nr:branched-chain amino acid ABC transporter permease [Candidatus Rokubacteria bacterium]
MRFLVQIVLSGIATGAIYGLVAVGYSVTYATMRVLNFGLGMWVMLGAMVGYTLHVTFGLNVLIAMLGMMTVLGGLGLLAERFTVLPFVRAGSDVWIMSTLAVGLLFINAAELLWGRNPLAIPPFLGKDPINFAGIGIYPQEILIVIVACAVMVALDVFYQYTLLGKAFRATASSTEVAGLMGINTRRIASLAYALAGCLAGFAGLLVAPVTLAEPQMGTILGLKAFAIAIIGGLEAGRGIFVCGLLYGVLEGLLSGYLYTGIRDIIGFTLMILVLFVRPNGLFGRRAEERA